MPQWLLITEASVLGLLLAVCIPVFGLVPMVFGVTEYTPAATARRVYILLALFPIVFIGAMLAAFFTDTDNPVRWLYAVLPLVHLAVLWLARVRS